MLANGDQKLANGDEKLATNKIRWLRHTCLYIVELYALAYIKTIVKAAQNPRSMDLVIIILRKSCALFSKIMSML
jgi:hypothetical protein